MDQKQVAELEQTLEAAIEAACRKLWRKSSFAPLEPRDNRTYHLMAKAAVTVLEAAEQAEAY